jgi:hypothetical protein
VDTRDAQAFAYAREHDLVFITCNRDDFLRTCSRFTLGKPSRKLSIESPAS